ncbi:MAG: 4-hydroxythreonine-4-phosphate dehydrogenase PdxA, partial [Cyanobacteria bacterium J06636_28]
MGDTSLIQRDPKAVSRPRLAITLGDPAGIGPEVVLKAIANPGLRQAADLTLVGNAHVLESLRAQVRDWALPMPLSADLPLLTTPEDIIELDVTSGQPSRVTGKASFRWLETAIAGAMAGDFDAVVTAPIAKSVWHTAGHIYPGQTEVLAERSGAQRFGMLFAAQSPRTGWLLRTLLATTHIPLNQVPTTLSPELMTRKLALLVDCLQQDFGVETPHIAIAGLNPHSGESGKL